MSDVYRGTVKGNVVVLEEGASLADGATVEVRVITHPSAAEAEDGGELLFKRRLLESGLLAESKPSPVPAADDRRAVRVRGRPLSEDILEERR